MSKKLIERTPGCVDPSEYGWEKQFDEATSGLEAFIPMDRGKVRGLAIAHQDALEDLVHLKKAATAIDECGFDSKLNPKYKGYFEDLKAALAALKDPGS